MNALVAMLMQLVFPLLASSSLIAPLMLQIQDSNGQLRRLSAEDFPDMAPEQLAEQTFANAEAMLAV